MEAILEVWFVVSGTFRRMRVAVIGAGFSGLSVAYRLREAGVEDFTLDAGADVAYHDPYIPDLPDYEISSVPLDESEVQKADCVVIGTNHDSIDLAMVVAASLRIVDLRNAIRKELGPDLPKNVDVL